MRFFALLLLASLYIGCQPEPAPAPPEAPALPAITAPQPQNQADSLALQIVDAMGGYATWAEVPFIRFDFVVEREGERRPAIRHFWNRKTGEYRVEMPVGEDSTRVVLMNVNTREGKVFLNEVAVSAEEQPQGLEDAYERYINDTYWLLAATKVLDGGVQRSVAADSAAANTSVLQLAFENVGLTPGDRYWLFADSTTGQVTRWTFVLEDTPADQPARSFAWTGYETHDTPAGPVTVSTRKELLGAPVAILTDNLAFPAEAPTGVFTDPNPMLGN